MKRKSRRIVYIASFGLVIGLFVIIATAHTPTPCDQILDKQVHTLNFDTLTPEILEEWIKSSYELTDADILHSEGQHKDNKGRTPKIYAWSFEGRRYDITTMSSYIKVSLSNKPTANDVIECFGAPSHYLATNMIFPDRTFIFELWYPERGIVISHVLLPGDILGYLLGWSHNSGANTLMDTIKVMKPDTVDALIKQIYTDNNWGTVTRLIRKWPGKLDKIQIDVH